MYDELALVAICVSRRLTSNANDCESVDTVFVKDDSEFWIPLRSATGDMFERSQFISWAIVPDMLESLLVINPRLDVREFESDMIPLNRRTSLEDTEPLNCDIANSLSIISWLSLDSSDRKLEVNSVANSSLESLSSTILALSVLIDDTKEEDANSSLVVLAANELESVFIEDERPPIDVAIDEESCVLAVVS